MLVSVIIPVRPGEDALDNLLAQLPPHDDVEIIVSAADAGSAAVHKVARNDVIWLESAPGRGAQLNAGAARASGRWFWFVHADSRLPPDWLEMFGSLDRSPGVNAGSFALRLDSAAWQARVIEAGVRWRVRWFDLPYGDQGLFVRRGVFAQVGGFPNIPLMEDVALARRLKRHGGLRHLTSQMVTSARRWEQEGWCKRSALNLAFLALYSLGASPEWLSRRYNRGIRQHRK